MVLVYIDESGNSNVTNREEIFVLTAVLINESDYKDIDLTILNFKEKISFEYGIPEDFEIHVRTLVGNKSKNDPLAEFKVITYKNRISILEKIYKLLESLEFKCISIAILKNELKITNDVRFWSNLLLLERIQMYMGDIPNNNYAMIHMDNENAEWNKKKLEILQTAIYYPSNQPSVIKIQKIVPAISFLDSSLNSGIQIADVMAYCIRRWLRFAIHGKKTELDEINIRGFDLLKKKLHRYPDCVQKGIKIFPSLYLDKVKNKLE